MVAASVLKGLESNLEDSGVDLGETQDLVEENITDEVVIEPSKDIDENTTRE